MSETNVTTVSTGQGIDPFGCQSTQALQDTEGATLLNVKIHQISKAPKAHAHGDRQGPVRRMLVHKLRNAGGGRKAVRKIPKGRW